MRINLNFTNIRILLFYENSDIHIRVSKSLNKNILKYPVKEIYKVKNINADFLIIETTNKEINNVITQLEIVSSIPYIIIAKNPVKEYHSLNLLKIINHNEINSISKIIDAYLNRVKHDEYSVFELTDVMQMISMEKKTIALRIIAENKVGAIAFKKGIPLYAKTIINKQVEFGIEAAFKIISWDNIKFKVVKIIGEIPVNMNTDLPNLLMGAMQYKDEIEYQNKTTGKIKVPDINNDLKINCSGISATLNKISGYIGISIFRNNEELCTDHSKNSYIKNKKLKYHVSKITMLVKTMLNDMGFQSFDHIILGTETTSTIIYHNEESGISIILFLEKNSNMALSKVIIKKIMLEIKTA